MGSLFFVFLGRFSEPLDRDKRILVPNQVVLTPGQATAQYKVTELIQRCRKTHVEIHRHIHRWHIGVYTHRCTHTGITHSKQSRGDYYTSLHLNRWKDPASSFMKQQLCLTSPVHPIGRHLNQIYLQT